MPSLTGRMTPTPEERDLLALPARFGGLGLTNPTTLSQEYVNSQCLSAPLVSLILQQSMVMGDACEEQLNIKASLRAEKGKKLMDAAAALKSRLPHFLSE